MTAFRTGPRRALLPLGAALAVLGASPAFADCIALDKEAQAAKANGERDRYGDLLRRALADPTCDSDYRARLARVLSLSSLKQLADKAKQTGQEPSLAELEAVRALASPWQLAISLGDAYYDRKDWPKAFQAYEAALEDMRDVKANPNPPPEALERHAYQRAVQARALAPTFIASRKVRGEPSGLASPNFRNFTVAAVPVPVRFAYDSSELVADGEAAAQEILDYVTSQGAKGVRLIGHTDPKGSDGYNLKLSEARAGAVKAYLAGKGYAGAVEIVAKGESEPFQADDPGKYTEEELFSMYRRVEYQLID
jgi:outer membrane protein OmpA-like peptidoglycan-associated protein